MQAQIEDMKVEFVNKPDPPEWKLNVLAYALCQECRKFYENPDNWKAFEEWKKQQGINEVKT